MIGIPLFTGYPINLLLVFSPWASFGQESELSQATGMALVRCILGKFLGVVCHCFPPSNKIDCKI